MLEHIRRFFTRHPAVRDAAWWVIPAVLVGAILRLMLLKYQPYAYWGADSRSYFDFAHRLLTEGQISLGEKRRYLYPILMVPVGALPGAPLKWLAWLQHGFGLLTLLPLAYVMRKTLALWRLWIVPVTLIYACFPMIVWYEHELLGETLFFALFLWSFAGWVAWISEPQLLRARRLFWCFFIPFALFIITKPSGRFVWPGIVVGLVMVAAWRRLDWVRGVALVALMLVTLTVGSKKQGAWIFYVATFPLTQVDSPLHADYKAEIRDDVSDLRRDFDVVYLRYKWTFAFLEDPSVQEERPLWKRLGKNSNAKAKLYMDLALEGVKAEPLRFAWLSIQRIIHSANPSQFKDGRFDSERYATKLESLYEEARGKRNSPIPFAFAVPKKQPMPPYAEIQKSVAPAQGSWSERSWQAYSHWFESVSDLVNLPLAGTIFDRQITKARPTALGWWLIAGLILSFLPRYRPTFGVWSVVVLGYLFGVFLCSQQSPRYFGLAWPVFVPLLALPADLLASLLARALALKRNAA